MNASSTAATKPKNANAFRSTRPLRNSFEIMTSILLFQINIITFRSMAIKKSLKELNSGKIIREATASDMAQSKASFRSGEFAGISPTENECGLLEIELPNGRKVLCYLE